MFFNLSHFFQKIKSSITWKIFKDSLLSVLFLIFLNLLNFSFFSLFLFFLLMLWIYFSQPGERQNFRTSFWITNFLFVFFLANIETLTEIKLVVLIFYGILMFFILGLINLTFKEKFVVYNVLNLLILFLLFINVFLFHPFFEKFSFWQILFWNLEIFVVISLIFLEFWRNFGVGFLKKEKLWSYLIGLIALELSMIVVFLPLGFFNAAIFLTLIMALLRDIYLVYENGLLNYNFVFRQLTIFIVISAIISLLVNWRVY